jgi:hypothetical protein
LGERGRPATADLGHDEFTNVMDRFARQHDLAPMSSYSSPLFEVASNADAEFSRARLKECDEMLGRFLGHFRLKGFEPQLPDGKLAIVIFKTQAGCEAYLGRKLSPLVTGLYQSTNNRLVMYDYASNTAHQARVLEAEREVPQDGTKVDRLRYLEAIYRRAREVSKGANTSTIMHEAAHQLSFNCGLLNRFGDVPLWLAEGLACYCEVTVNGAWQGPGEVNSDRLGFLITALRGRVRFLGLRDLITTDNWLKNDEAQQSTLLGYAQSWVLFRFLMQEEPQALRTYLRLTYSERVAERRLANFQQAFGTNLSNLERRYFRYLVMLLKGQLSAKR